MSNIAAADQIRSVIERAERLHEERDELGGHLSDLFKEARSNGLDPRALKEVIRLRRMDKADRQEREELVSMYLAAVGD